MPLWRNDPAFGFMGLDIAMSEVIVPLHFTNASSPMASIMRKAFAANGAHASNRERLAQRD